MPIRCRKGQPRYRVKTFKTGKRIRLAYCGNKLEEVKRFPRKKK